MNAICEFTAPPQLRYDAATRQLSTQLESPGKPRHSVTLLLRASAEFGLAFELEQEPAECLANGRQRGKEQRELKKLAGVK